MLSTCCGFRGLWCTACWLWVSQVCAGAEVLRSRAAGIRGVYHVLPLASADLPTTRHRCSNNPCLFFTSKLGPRSYRLVGHLHLCIAVHLIDQEQVLKKGVLRKLGAREDSPRIVGFLYNRTPIRYPEYRKPPHGGKLSLLAL